MKLSIITINLNNCDGLKRTIDSVVSQSFTDYEWILIDGGSTDGSRELIEQHQNHFAYWCSEPDKGIYNAMNKGIRYAKGDYLQFLNSGDWLCDAITLERCFSYNFNADIVYGNIYLCTEKKLIKHYYPQSLTFRYLIKDTLGHSNTFIKKDVIQETPYDESLKIVSDWKFFLTQALKNKKIEYINEFVSCYDTTGISSTNIELLEKERNIVLSTELSPLIRADYETMDKMERVLNHPQIKKIVEYRGKRTIYQKMITACLLVIELMDKILWKRQKSQ